MGRIETSNFPAKTFYYPSRRHFSRVGGSAILNSFPPIKPATFSTYFFPSLLPPAFLLLPSLGLSLFLWFSFRSVLRSSLCLSVPWRTTLLPIYRYPGAVREAEARVYVQIREAARRARTARTRVRPRVATERRKSKDGIDENGTRTGREWDENGTRRRRGKRGREEDGR